MVSLGAYPVDYSGYWTPPEYWDADDTVMEMADHPNIWTDGGREDFCTVGGFEVAGAGVHVPAPELAFDGAVWGVSEEYGDARLERCRAFLPVPGVMQTVQRAEFWGAIVALQAYWPCHSGIDNLNVARTIGRLLDKDCLVKPLPLVKDGDLVALVQYMIRTRSRETVRVTEVKGHAEDSDVQQGRVRLEDQLGNAEAGAAADLGRRHQSEFLTDARRKLLKVRNHWYPILLQLQRFKIAVARVTVNHVGRGGTAPDPLVWDLGGRKKTRRTDIRVNVDLASLPGPPAFLTGPWMQVHGVVSLLLILLLLPCSVGILCKFTAFLGSLHCPVDNMDMGHFGVSYLEVLILFEQWAGHRLLSEKVTRPHVMGLIVPFRFPLFLCQRELKFDMVVSSSVAWLRTLAKFPGGMGGLLPCGIGSHMSKLRHLGWNNDGESGTAPDPLVWDQVSKPKVRKLAIMVNVDLAPLPGPPKVF